MEQTNRRYPRSHYDKVIGEYCYRAMERVRIPSRFMRKIVCRLRLSEVSRQ